MLKVKNFIRKLVFKEKYDSESYISYLRKKGVRIGDDCTIYVPKKTLIDIQKPYLLEIGNHVRITNGVTILTHGYEWSVLKGYYGTVMGTTGKVKIGNNVFIGMNSTILKGVTVGDNVIIGASSLVNKDIPSNSVAAGNPIRVIMSLDEYYEKRKTAQIDEAKQLVKEYRNVYGNDPSEDELKEYFWLFSNKEVELIPSWKFSMNLVDNYNQSIVTFQNHNKSFESFDDFLKSV